MILDDDTRPAIEQHPMHDINHPDPDDTVDETPVPSRHEQMRRIQIVDELRRQRAERRRRNRR